MCKAKSKQKRVTQLRRHGNAQEKQQSQSTGWSATHSHRHEDKHKDTQKDVGRNQKGLAHSVVLVYLDTAASPVTLWPTKTSMFPLPLHIILQSQDSVGARIYTTNVEADDALLKRLVGVGGDPRRRANSAQRRDVERRPFCSWTVFSKNIYASRTITIWPCQTDFRRKRRIRDTAGPRVQKGYVVTLLNTMRRGSRRRQ